MARATCPVAAGLLAAGLLLALPAAAQQGEWRLGGRGLSVKTDETIEPLAVLDCRLAFDDSWTIELDATYMLDHQLGLEWTITSAPHNLTAVGGVWDRLEVGEVWIAQSTLTIAYEVPLWGRWRPYLGLGVGGAYLHSSDITAPGIRSIDSDLIAGAVGRIGVAYRYENRWILTLDLRYGRYSGEVRIEASDGTTSDRLATDLEPMLIGLGVAYRF